MATLDQKQHWKQHYSLRVDLMSVTDGQCSLRAAANKPVPFKWV
jgi:hypothetical protein